MVELDARDLRQIADIADALSEFYKKTIGLVNGPTIDWEYPGFDDIKLPIIDEFTRKNVGFICLGDGEEAVLQLSVDS